LPTKKIRVYELARELGVENQVVLDLCERLKIGVKSHSSSIDDPLADRVRRLADAEGLRREPTVDEPEPAPAEKATKATKATRATKATKAAKAAAPVVEPEAPAAVEPAVEVEVAPVPEVELEPAAPEPVHRVVRSTGVIPDSTLAPPPRPAPASPAPAPAERPAAADTGTPPGAPPAPTAPAGPPTSASGRPIPPPPGGGRRIPPPPGPRVPQGSRPAPRTGRPGGGPGGPGGGPRGGGGGFAPRTGGPGGGGFQRGPGGPGGPGGGFQRGGPGGGPGGPGGGPGGRGRTGPQGQRPRRRKRRRRDFEDLGPASISPNLTPSDTPVPEGEIVVERGITIQELAPKLNRTTADLVRLLFDAGEMVTGTQSLADEMVELIAEALGADVLLVEPGQEAELELQALLGDDDEDDEASRSRARRS
jgi:translation initiation factor IF-2